MGRNDRLDVIANDQSVILSVAIKTRRRDLAMDRAWPRPGQKVAARSNRQQTPDSVALAGSAHSHSPAVPLGHNYNQLLLDAVPG